MRKFLLLFLSLIFYNYGQSQNTFTFTVKDGSNNPISDASVDLNGGMYGNSVMTDANGMAVFNDIPDNDYSYNISKLDFKNASGNVTINGISPTTLEVILEDLVYYNVDFLVQNNSLQPIEGASIQINAPYFGNPPGITDASGNATILDVPNTNPSYYIAKEGYRSSNQSFDPSLLNVTATLVNADVVTVTINVYDSNSTPVDGASVELSNQFGSNFTQVTDVNGDAIFNSMFEGDYTVKISKPTYTDINSGINVTLGNSNMQFQLNLTQYFNITYDVKDDQNIPIEGALIDFTNPAITDITTNASGIALANMPDGNQEYQVLKDGYQVMSNMIDVFQDQTVSVILSPIPLTSATFNIQDNNNTPIEGVTVHLGTGQFQDVITDAQGMAVFNDIPEGNYEYNLSKVGFEAKTGNAYFSANNVNEFYDFLTPIANLTINVLDENNSPVANAQVSLNNDPNNTLPTDAQGNVLFENIPLGNYNISISKAGYVQKEDWIDLQANSNLTFNIELIQYLTINFTIKDNNQQPLEGVLIDFEEAGLTDLTTDASGFATASNFPSGNHNYTLSKNGYNTKQSGRNFSANETEIYENLMQTGNFSITFQITDVNSNPVQNVNINVEDAAWANTDVNGIGIIENLPAGTLHWNFWHQDFQPAEGTIDLTQSTTFQYQMQTEQLSTKIVYLNVVDAQGQPIANANVQYEGGNTTTDANGIAELLNLPVTREIGVNISKNGYTEFNTQVMGNDNNDQTINAVLKIASTATITFVLTDELGNPVPNTYVNFPNLNNGVQTNASGIAYATNLPLGNVVYQAWLNDNYKDIKDSVLLGNSDMSINIQFEKIVRSPYWLTVYAVDEQNNPLPGAYIPMDNDSLIFDGNGIFTMNNIEVGTYNLILKKDGYEDAPFTVTIDLLGDKVYNITLRKIVSIQTNVKFVVKDDNSTPIEGANVIIDNNAPILTDVNGEVNLTNLTVGNHNYTISKDGFNNINNQFNLGNEALTIPITLMPTSGIVHTLNFDVKDLLGNPISDVTLKLDGLEKTTTGVPVAFDNVSEGLHFFSALKNGYEAVQNELTVTDVSLKDILVGMKKLVNISFHVTDIASSPIADAWVTINNLSAKTDSNGDVIFPNIPEGNFDYNVQAENAIEMQGNFDANSDFTQNVTLSPLVFNVSFKIINNVNVPIQNASVTFNGNTLQTNATGDVLFENVMKGEARPYLVVASNYNNNEGTLNVNQNIQKEIVISDQTYNVNIRTLSGTTILPNVSLILDGGTIQTSDANGLTTFTMINAGQHSIEALSDGYQSLIKTIEVKNADMSVDFNLSLNTYNLSLKIVDNNNIPVKNAAIKVGNFIQFTDFNGYINFLNLKNGIYNYKIDKPGFETIENSITINGVDFYKEIALSPAIVNYNVTINVTDGVNPVSDAHVILYDQDILTDASGNVTFKTVSPGLYMYQVKKEGYKTAYNDLEVKDADISKTAILKMINLPIDFTISSTNIAENMPPYSVLASFAPVTNNANYTYKYRISDFGNNSEELKQTFYITDNNLYANKSLNFEERNQYSIIVNSIDNFGNIVKKTFELNIQNSNDAPKIVSSPILNTETNVAYQYILKGFDEDNDALTVNAVIKPDWLTVGTYSNGEAIISGTPLQEGTYVVQLELSDGNAKAIQNFVIVAKSSFTNTKPVCVAKTVQVKEDRVLYTQLLASDDNTSLERIVFEITQAPTHGNFVLEGNKLTYSPNQNWFGSEIIKFRARDSYGLWSDEAVLNIDILSVNDQPTALSGEFDVSTTANVINIQNLISDVESPAEDLKLNFILAYSSTEGKGVLGGKFRKVNGTFWEYLPETNSSPIDFIYFNVEDPEGGTSDVKVIKINKSVTKGVGTENVIVDNIIARSVTYNDAQKDKALTVELIGIDLGNFQALSIVPAESLTYGSIEWDEITSESGLSSLKGTYTPNVDENVSEVIPFIVSDGTTTVTAYAIINISTSPKATVIDEIENQSTNQSQTITVPISFTDLTNVSWTATANESNSGLAFEFTDQTSNTVNLKITTDAVVDGNLIITVEANNEANLTSQLNFGLTVSPTRQAPEIDVISDVNEIKNMSSTITIDYSDMDSGIDFIAWEASANIEGFKFEFTNKTTSTIDLIITPISDYVGDVTVSITATDEYFLAGSQEFKVTYSHATAIDEIYTRNIKIYPNPSNEFISISGLEKGASIYFYDMNGRMVKSCKRNNLNSPINISELGSGVYTVRIIENEYTSVKKIIVSKK